MRHEEAQQTKKPCEFIRRVPGKSIEAAFPCDSSARLAQPEKGE
jgi:hypothetical protein